VGVGGVIDVASKWNIKKWEADLARLSGSGAGNQMLPDAAGVWAEQRRTRWGLATDTAANPLTYLSPYPFVTTQPFTYLSPYTYYSYAVMYNNLSDSVDGYVRTAESEKDAYSELQYAWGFVRENRVVNFQAKANPTGHHWKRCNRSSSPSKTRSSQAARTDSVLIPTTGKQLKFTHWLRPGQAPIVYIVPGLGSHRLTESAIALAELVYRRVFGLSA